MPKIGNRSKQRASTLYKNHITAVLLSTILLLSVGAASQAASNVQTDERLTDTPLVPSSTQNASANTLAEALLPSIAPVARSFEYPVLRFAGETSTLVQTMIWYTNGTVAVSDTRGYQISMSIPTSQGTFELLQNSTMVAQKVTGPELQYTVYWKPVKSSEGFVDRYKFSIEGTSVGASNISIDLKSDDYLHAQGNKFMAIKSAPGLIDSSLPVPVNGTAAVENAILGVQTPTIDGLGFDWSDAVASGYQVQYDAAKASLNIPVSTSFSIDPYVIATVSTGVSPGGTDYFEGEVRAISLFNGTAERIYAFYYTGSNIVYKTSDDMGKTWSTSTSLSTGVLAADYYRWTIATTTLSNTTYVCVIYWKPLTSNTNIKAKRGTVSGLNITWDSPITVRTVSNYDSGGAYVGTTTATDTNGNIYAAFRWLPSASYKYEIWKSTDGGLSWTSSLGPVTLSGQLTRPPFALAALNSTKMLFAFGNFCNGKLFYRVFDGSAWGAKQELTAAVTGMQSCTYKQFSAASNGTLSAYVAYTNVTLTGAGGLLKVARFSNTGTFEAVETAESTLRHKLPNIMFNFNGDLNINSLANNEVYNTRKTNGIWESPFNPYGTSPTAPDQLTGTNLMNRNSDLWVETTNSNLMFDTLRPGTIVAETHQQVSPKLGDWYEGQRRAVINSNQTMFSVYYDGSNIVYTKSDDLGFTWSSPISTGTGVIAPDNYRWSLAYSGHQGQYNDRIALLYYQLSGSNTKFYQKTFKANDDGLVLVSTVNTFQVTTASGCSVPPTNLCATSAGASDQNGTLWTGYRWKGSTDWQYSILMSSDGGSTWSTSVPATSIPEKFAMTLTSLNGTKMLFAYARDAQSDLFYRVFDGSTWSSVNIISAGITTGVPKQLSSSTVNGTKQAYVAFLSGGYQGTLKVARFSGNGVFEAIETADSTLTHALPAISVTYDDDIRINTVSNNIVYETKKNNSGWQVPTTPYGTTFSIADQITAPTTGLINTGTSFTEGSGAFALFFFPIFDLRPNGGLWKCDYLVTVTMECIAQGAGGLAGTFVITPYTYLKPDKCSFDKTKLCARIDHETHGYPSSIPRLFQQWPFKHGVIQMCLKEDFFACKLRLPRDRWETTGSSGLDLEGGLLKFIDHPLKEPTSIWLVYTYKDPIFGWFRHDLTIEIDLSIGYGE